MRATLIRLAVSLVAFALSIGSVPAALAYSTYCESWYENGEECYRECWHYDDDGNFIGHVSIDYQC